MPRLVDGGSHEFTDGTGANTPLGNASVQARLAARNAERLATHVPEAAAAHSVEARAQTAGARSPPALDKAEACGEQLCSVRPALAGLPTDAADDEGAKLARTVSELELDLGHVKRPAPAPCERGNESIKSMRRIPAPKKIAAFINTAMASSSNGCGLVATSTRQSGRGPMPRINESVDLSADEEASGVCQSTL